MSRPSIRTAISIAIASMLGWTNPLPAQMQMPACHGMPSAAPITAPADLPPPQKLSGIGNLHFPISSKNPETQAWFDQGINLVYDFWDYEANRAFQQAVRTDPSCAICHWGLAQSLGIHNAEVQSYAHDELAKAIALRSKVDKRENLYIDAAEAEQNAALAPKEARDAADEKIKSVLRELIRLFPKDITARMMLSDAVSDGFDEGKPRKGTQESQSILKLILQESPDNSAANHLWIHSMEPSNHPELALHSAEILASLSPNSGHMTHMPGHIFYRGGDYQRAQVAFDLSMSVDEAYMQTQHVSADNDWNYVHNLMYSIANLMEQGQMSRAATVSNKLTIARGSRASTMYPWSTRDSMTRLNLRLPIALRTSDWSQILALLSDANHPDSQPNLQRLAAALTMFAKGMQAANESNLDAARKASEELDSLLWRISSQVDEEAAVAKKQPDTPAKPENLRQSTDPTLKPMLSNLSILSLELRAAILVRSKKYEDAKPLFAQARREEQELGYHEPPAFIRPVAEQSAELWIDAGQNTEAEKDLKLALEDHPKSGFPLYALALLTEKSGDAVKTGDAYDQFLTAWKSADPDLPQVKHAQRWRMDHPQPMRLAETGPGVAPKIPVQK